MHFIWHTHTHTHTRYCLCKILRMYIRSRLYSSSIYKCIFSIELQKLWTRCVCAVLLFLYANKVRLHELFFAFTSSTAIQEFNTNLTCTHVRIYSHNQLIKFGLSNLVQLTNLICEFCLINTYNCYSIANKLKIRQKWANN